MFKETISILLSQDLVPLSESLCIPDGILNDLWVSIQNDSSTSTSPVFQTKACYNFGLFLWI